MAKKIVVVGYGLAAHRFVTRLLAGDEDLDITVYAGEDDAPYDRTRLPDLVAARDRGRAPLPRERVAQRPAAPEITPADSFFSPRRAGVAAYQDCRVRSLEGAPSGAVSAAILADGSRLSCDLAVIACGTAPNVA